MIEPTGTPAKYLDANEQTTNISCNVTNAVDEPVFSYYNSYPGTASKLNTPASPNQVKIIELELRISSTGNNPMPVSKLISEYIAPRNINREEWSLILNLKFQIKN